MTQYGEIRVDYITFTTGTAPNQGNVTIPVSGLINNPTPTGDVIIGGDLTVSGDITARNITATGDLSVSGETLTSGLIVQNDATISGDLDVLGEVTAGSVNATGTLTVSGATNVSGLLTTSGLSVTGTADVNALNVTGLAAVGTLTATGSATINGPTTLNSGLTVNGDTSTFNETVTIASGLTVTNGGIVVSNAGGLNVDGNVIFQDNLTVSGTTSLNDAIVTGVTTLNELTVTGPITLSTGRFAPGTETEPSISFAGDTDTGFYNPASNEVRITTSGVDRLTVDDTGKVGIGTTNPGTKLEVLGTSTDAVIYINSTSIGANDFNGGGAGLLLTAGGMNSTSKFTPAIRFGSSDPDFTTQNPKTLAAINGIATQTYSSDTNGAMALAFYTTSGGDAVNNVQERMRISQGGNVGIGTTSPDSLLEVNGTSAADNFKETVFTITWTSGFALTPSNGETQFVVLGGNSTPTQSNWGNGESLTLHIDDGSNRTINWTTLGVVWTGGSPPDLATTGDTVIQFWKAQNTIYGALVGEVA